MVMHKPSVLRGTAGLGTVRGVQCFLMELFPLIRLRRGFGATGPPWPRLWRDMRGTAPAGCVESHPKPSLRTISDGAPRFAWQGFSRSSHKTR